MASKTVKCPNCGKKVVWSEDQQYKPFCSERCKLIDFGEWASQQKAIPGEPEISDDDSNDSNQYLQ